MDEENRGRYDRTKLRYPSDLTDEEWALIGRSIPPTKRGGNKRTVEVSEIVNGVMYILSTGCQWTARPKHLPAQYRSTTTSGAGVTTAHSTASTMRSTSSAVNTSDGKPPSADFPSASPPEPHMGFVLSSVHDQPRRRRGIRGSSPSLVIRHKRPHHLTSGRTVCGPDHNPACLRVQGSEGWDPSWGHGISQPRFRSVTIHPGSGGSAQPIRGLGCVTAVASGRLR